MATVIENEHVTHIYNNISREFGLTRSSPWPFVKNWIEDIAPGSFVADIGCGNCVNQFRNDINWMSLDSCLGMCECAQESCLANVHNIPYRSNIFDNVISIACIHHLSTQQRRINAVKECYRILKPGGVCLISVWKEHSRGSGDQMINWKTNKFKRFYHLFSHKEALEVFRGYDYTVCEEYNNFFFVIKKSCRC
jgi:ubiquinone/menaquinone biosynthesis C-methylase UbiE